MKRSEELRIKKTEKIERMQTIVAAAEKENKRQLTDDEQTEWDRLDGEVRSLTTEIQRAERMEVLGDWRTGQKGKSNRQDTDPEDGDGDGDGSASHQRGGSGPAIHTRRHVYSVGKAVREYSSRRGIDGLTGMEAEQHQELSRHMQSDGLLIPAPSIQRALSRAQTVATFGDSIDVHIDPNLSMIGGVPIYAQMGLNIVEGLHGSFKIGKQTAVIAAKKADGVAIDVSPSAPIYATVGPDRYGVTDKFDKELLAQENPMVQTSIMNNMMMGCDRKITKEVYDVLTAVATEVAGVDLTNTGLLSLMAAVAEGGAFTMARGTFFEAMDVKVDAGSGKFLAGFISDDNGIGKTSHGAKAFYSDLFADAVDKKYVYYGSMRHIWAGFWGALEVVYNPFTFGKEGQVELTVNRLAHIASQNDAAFRRSPDLNPA